MIASRLRRALAETIERIAAVLRNVWSLRWRVLGLAVLLVAAAAAYLYYDYHRDVAEAHFDDPVKQFKYGSTGGDRLAGIPAGIFKALPQLCRDYLPGEGWQSLGFVFEPGMDRPAGTSKRRTLGFDRIALNCAACHVGTYRETPQSTPVVVAGMPANHIDLGRFTQFLTDCALDERFNPWQVVQAAERTGENYSLRERLLLQYIAVPAMREALILARYRFRFLGHEVTPGPGRFDTFGPAKALLNWPIEKLPPRESVGIVDFPSLWLQGPRAAAAMRLHWDGNNDSVEERNRSAAFGTGAVPTLIDRKSLRFIADWLRSDKNQPPKYPFPIDRGTGGARQSLVRRILRRLPRRERTRFHGRSGRHRRADRRNPHRPVPPRQLHACARGGAGQSVRRLSRRTLLAFPQDRRLRQPAARRSLAAGAVSA